LHGLRGGLPGDDFSFRGARDVGGRFGDTGRRGTAGRCGPGKAAALRLSGRRYSRRPLRPARWLDARISSAARWGRTGGTKAFRPGGLFRGFERRGRSVFFPRWASHRGAVGGLTRVDCGYFIEGGAAKSAVFFFRFRPDRAKASARGGVSSPGARSSLRRRPAPHRGGPKRGGGGRAGLFSIP